MFFELENERNNTWKFNLIWVVKCLLTDLSKNSMCNNYLQSSSTLHCALCLNSGFEKTIPWEFCFFCTLQRWPGRYREAWLREIAGAHTHTVLKSYHNVFRVMLKEQCIPKNSANALCAWFMGRYSILLITFGSSNLENFRVKELLVLMHDPWPVLGGYQLLNIPADDTGIESSYKKNHTSLIPTTRVMDQFPQEWYECVYITDHLKIMLYNVVKKMT